MVGRAIVVHGFAQACAALRPGRPVTLLSGPGAGWYGGAGWWMALLAAARDAVPGTPATDLLDCGPAPGAAMAALRAGQRGLVLHPCAGFAAVAAAGAALGARVVDRRPKALDLADPDAARRLAAWLAQADDSSTGLR